MRILVTGGNGQLGRSLAKVAGDYPGHTMLFTDLPEGDITDQDKMASLVANNGTELIINCAGYTAVDRAESEPEAARLINAGGPAILAGIAKQAGARLIHISSDYVFDGRSDKPITEESPANPLGVYGRTKFEGEREIAASGCDAVVLRTSWLYSEFGSNFVKTILKLGRERGEVKVVCDQTGSPTYAAGLARAIMHFAGKPFAGFEIYNYSDEGAVSWYGFAEEIFSLAGMKVTVRGTPSTEYPAAALRPAYSVTDKTKIKAAGVEVHPWKENLAQCLAELKNLRP